MILFIFCCGLAVGSFLNVVVIRGHKGESLGGRSHCVHCATVLSVRELIPVFSFLIQKARCRNCKGRISWQYPLVELACGLLYVLGFTLIGDSSYLWTYEKVFFSLAWFIGIPAMLVILVSDFRFQTIPDGATLTLGAIGVGATLLRAFLPSTAELLPPEFMTGIGTSGLAYDLITVSIISGILWALWFFSDGRWMGFGDVKLIFATSLILGFPAAIAGFLFAFWSGSIVGILLLLTGKKRWRQHIPFGPFILLGGGLALLFSSLFFNQVGLGTLVVL